MAEIPARIDPLTEAGLQACLTKLSEARANNDDASAGRALLDLAHIVKWAGSDNSLPPFERSHSLAIEALDIFRRLVDKGGEISALLLAVPFEPRESGAEMLLRAEALAAGSGDELEVARVLGVRARQLAMLDRKKAKELTHQALAIYRERGHAAGAARCLFSLSISEGTNEEKVECAVEAAKLYRQVGDRKNACKAVTIALMNAERNASLESLEPEIMAALEDAQAVEDRSTEERCYRYLARIAEARGDTQEAAKFLRWEAELKDSDGLSPEERKQQHEAMSGMMIAMAQRMGNQEMERSFRDELQRS